MADYPDIRAAAERLAEKDRAAFRPLPPGMTPQEAMRGLDAEKEMRVPAIVGAKLPDLDTLLEDRKVNRQLEASPRVKQFLQDGINAGLAKDDISNLSLIEKAGNHVAKGGLRSASGVVMRLAARNMELADFAGMGRNEILDKLISPEDRKRLIQEGNSSGVGLYMRDAAEIARAVEGTTAEEFRAGAMSAVETAGGLEKTARGLKGFEWGEEFARKYAEPAIKQPTASGQAMELLKGFAADPVGGWVFLQGIVLESTPMLAGAAVTGAVTRSPAAAVAALGVGSGTAEYSGEVQQFLGSKGIDITTDEGRRMLLNSPEIMAEADRKGFLKGAVIGMMDAMSGAIAGRALSKSPVGNMFAQMIVQAALGGGGEFLGDVAAGNDPNAANVILEALAEFVSAPGEVAIFAGRKAFAKDASRAEKATNVRTTLEPVAEATANSKLRERSKERFKAFLGQTDWADVDLRVDAEELRTLFQAKDVGPETWGIDPVEYETALASGGMVSIPSESIAEIAGTADAEWLMANATLSDDAMSESEAARFNEEFRDELDRFAAEQDRLAEAERQSRASDVQVRDAIFEQLRAAGRTADVAQRESAVWQSFFRTMAERYGDDPLDLARQFGVRIQGPSDARSRIRGNLDIALNTLRRQKPARKAQGLVDFLIRKGGVRDRGGDVADMEGPGRLISETAGDARQAALFPMEGKGMSLDEAARLAAEEGFFPDQIGKEYLPERVATDLVPLLLDAIRRDIAGESVVRLEDMPLPDDLAALFEEIDKAGLTLDMTNDEIVKALGFDEYAGEGALFQENSPLYVVHNLSAENLRHVKDLGGLAAPSLAIARADIGMENFGEISLIGDPSMADPKGRGTKAFNADVYSPRQPRGESDISAKALKKAYDRVAAAAEDLGQHPSDVIQDAVVSREGLDAVAREDAVRLTYLREKSDNVRIRYREQKPIPEMLRRFKGRGRYDLMNDPEFAIAATEKLMADVAQMPEGIRDDMRSRFFTDEGRARQRYVDNIAFEVEANSGPRKVDPYETGRAIRKKIEKSAKSRNEYEAWVRETFGDMLDAKFFRSDSGRRRAYTLENVVREMTRTIRDGEGFNYGPGSIRSLVARQFRSLSAIQQARGDIISPEAMEALKKEAMDDLSALADEFAPYHSSGKDFGWLDIFSEFLKDLSRGNLREWQREIFNEPVPDELIGKARGYLNKLTNMPTEYFEIKMQRAVSLSEFEAALVPNNAPSDVLQILQDAGLKVVRYDRNSETGRLDALRKVGDNVFFQQQTPEQFLASEGEWRDQSVTVQDEDGNDVQVSAGLAADVLMERLEQARQILECVNAG